MKKVLLTPRSFHEAGEGPRNLLRDNGFEVIENTTGKTLSEDQMVDMCKDIEGLIVGIDPVSSKVLEQAIHLKAISKYGVGLDNIDLDAARKLNIKVDRAVNANTTSVAELAVGLFFALARNIVSISASTQQGGWKRIRGVEITGKTLGLVGLGSIGQEVARMAKGLGMKIFAYDPYIDKNATFIKDFDIKITEFEKVIESADFLSLHLPLTSDTKNIINTYTLQAMKSTAFLINTSRGELVDENALYQALILKNIAGAASDVFSKEPPGEHPLLNLENFVLTSHIGAYTKEANQRMAEISAKNLIRMLSEI